ncbi:DUF6950 family protein [Brevundimonas viscosa]|uniref:DUF6950 domain-containing protein n=1 Tax=Brevundimonas viscosa TaxID=871741 RepID=A0A1I6PPN4_9CAUL|nr:hypothetical protein [Brevundimonas viscosa]SFS42172.1 hypothetical protein SAMN05192570_1161 [Brevundimonas viscosa]
MSPMIRRVEAVQATIDRFRDKPLKLGTDDCVRMAAFALRKQGVRASLLKAGSYSSEAGARRVMKRLGYETLAEAVDALGLPRIAPAMALPGDILTLPAADGSDLALAVAVGNGRVLGFWEAAGVCTVFQPLRYDAAWRSI